MQILISLFVGLPVFASALVFFTGPPQLSNDPGQRAIDALFDQKEYRAFVKRDQGIKSLVFIRKSPANLSSSALYGNGFPMGGRPHGYILDGNNDSGWVLYLDWKGNGDLSGAKPQPLKRVNGVYQLQLEVKDRDVQWACRLELTRYRNKPEVSMDYITVRRGLIEIGGKRAPFALNGGFGKYDDPYEDLTIDRTGSGKIESYTVAERYLNLFGKSYEFKVNPRGDSLALTELPKARPDRPALTVGSKAPDFEATDTTGMRRNLAGYRGRLLLLEFWGTWCGPCKRDAPHLVKFYSTTQRNKLEILGVSTDDSEATLRSYLFTSGIKWPQIREADNGALHRLYRANGFPTYYLIGAAGQIVDTWVGGEKLARLTKYRSGS